MARRPKIPRDSLAEAQDSALRVLQGAAILEVETPEQTLSRALHGQIPAQARGESPEAYDAFLRWVRAAARYGVAWADQLIADESPEARQWREQHRWLDRFERWRDAATAEILAHHRAAVQRARASAVDAVPMALEVIRSVAMGLNPPDPRTGRPQVPARDRLHAASLILEIAGVAKPRRVEITADDTALAVARVRQHYARLQTEELLELARVFGLPAAQILDADVAEEVADPEPDETGSVTGEADAGEKTDV